jgi:hypothetical protein
MSMLINESLNSIIMITHIHIFLAYFPERKVGLSNQVYARVSVCPRSLRSSKNDQKALLASVQRIYGDREKQLT